MPLNPESLRLASRFGQLAAALHAEDTATLAAGGRQAYALAFAVTAVVGLLLGLLALWGGWSPLHVAAMDVTGLALLTTATLLAALTFWFSGRTLRREVAAAPSLVARCAAWLASAFTLASASAVPWLLACAVLPQPQLALALAVLAAITFALGWWVLGRRAAQVLL